MAPWKPRFLLKFLKKLNCKLYKVEFFKPSHLTVFASCIIFLLEKTKLFAICVYNTTTKNLQHQKPRTTLLGSGQFRRVKAPEKTIGGDLRGWYIYDHGAVCHLLHNRADSTLVKSIKPTVGLQYILHKLETSLMQRSNSESCTLGMGG